MARNPLTNPFWFGSYFRKHPILGLIYHLLKAIKFAGRLR